MSGPIQSTASCYYGITESIDLRAQHGKQCMRSEVEGRGEALSTIVVNQTTTTLKCEALQGRQVYVLKERCKKQCGASSFRFR